MQDYLKSDYRHAVSSGTLQKQWENVRKTYESSDALTNYRASGQGNPNFSPHFCDNNAVHVLLHYIIRDAKEDGESDLELCILSCMAPSVQANSLDGADTTDLESITSAGATQHSESPKPNVRDPIVKHLKKLASILTKSVSAGTMRQKRKLVLDPDEEKEWQLRKLRKKVRDLLEEKARIMQLQEALASDDSGQEYLDEDLHDVRERITKAKTALKPHRSRTTPVVAPTSPAPVSGAGMLPGMTATTPMWMGRLSASDQSSLCKAMDMVSKQKFQESSKKYSETFEGETCYECTKTQKKACGS